MNIFIVLLFIACGRSAHEEQFDRAENLLLSAPDSAVSLIDSLQRDSSRLSRAELMHLRIIMADQLNKTYQPIALTPELQEAVTWYDRHGTPNERMRAICLLGYAHQCGDEFPAAVTYYEKAADSADTLSSDCDYRLLSRVYSHLSEAYGLQRAHQMSIEALTKGMRYAIIAKDTLAAISFRAIMAEDYQALGNIDSVLSISLETHEQYKRLGYDDYAGYTLAPVINASIDSVNPDIKRLKYYMDIYEGMTGIFDENHIIHNGRDSYYYVKGEYYLKTGSIDSALIMFRNSSYLSHRLKDRMNGLYGLHNAFLSMGERDSAMKYAEEFFLKSDTVNKQLATEEVIRTSKLYNYERNRKEAERSRAEAEKEHVRVFLLLSLCLLLLVSGGTLFIYLRKRSKLRITKLQMRLDDACEELQSTESDLAMLRLNNAEAIASLRKEKEKKEQQLHKTITELTELLDASHKDNGHPYTKTGTDDEVDTLIRLFRQSPVDHPITSDKWKRIIRYIKRASPRFYEKIWRNDSLSIVEKKLCVLIYLGIKPSLISIALDRSSQDVTNMRTRLLMRVFGMKGGAKDFDSLICKI
ncbi:MAG: hypothetical protein K6A98_05550 [Prevotella sp.]|nr:hypothetical protein [Prevotella sp.]